MVKWSAKAFANERRRVKVAKESQTVADFMDKLEHPMKSEIEELRAIVRGADARLAEGLKWNAPSYSANGEDRITFNLQGKGFIRLIFHAGTEKTGVNLRAAWGDDSLNLLEWAADDRAIVKLTGTEDIWEKAERLGEVIRRWIDIAG